MKKSEFDKYSENRSVIIKQYSFHCGNTKNKTTAELASILNDFAIRQGLIERIPHLYGETIKEWSIKNNAPLWACKAALMLLVQDGWLPVSLEDWAVFAYIWIRINPETPVNILVSQLPETFEKTACTGWLCAAKESQQVFQMGKLLND